MFAFFFLRYKDKKFFLKTQSFKKGNINGKKGFLLDYGKISLFLKEAFLILLTAGSISVLEGLINKIKVYIMCDIFSLLLNHIFFVGVWKKCGVSGLLTG